MKTELEQILPEKIEERSFEIISEELNALFPEKTFLPEEELILKRVIHTTADFDYAENLIFSEGAGSAEKRGSDYHGYEYGKGWN